MYHYISEQMALVCGTFTQFMQLQQIPSASISYPGFEGWGTQAATSFSATRMFQQFTPNGLVSQEDSIICISATQYEMLQSGSAVTAIPVENVYSQYHSLESNCLVHIQFQNVMPMVPPYIQDVTQQDVLGGLILGAVPSTELYPGIEQEIVLPSVSSMGSTYSELENIQTGGTLVLRKINQCNENSAVSVGSCYPMSTQEDRDKKNNTQKRKSRIPIFKKRLGKHQHQQPMAYSIQQTQNAVDNRVCPIPEMTCPVQIEETKKYTTQPEKKLKFPSESKKLSSPTQTWKTIKYSTKFEDKLLCPTNLNRKITSSTKPCPRNPEQKFYPRKPSKSNICAVQTGKKICSTKTDVEVSCSKGLCSSGNPCPIELGMSDSAGKNAESLHVTPPYEPLIFSKHKGQQERGGNYSQIGKDRRKSNQWKVYDIHDNKMRCSTTGFKSSNMIGALQKEIKPGIHLKPASRSSINQNEPDNNDHSTSCSMGLNSFGNPCPKELLMSNFGEGNQETILAAPSYVPIMISKHKELQEKGKNCSDIRKHTRKRKHMIVSDIHRNKPVCTTTDMESSIINGAPQKKFKLDIHVEPTTSGINPKQPDSNDCYPSCSKDLYSSRKSHLKELVRRDSGWKNAGTPLKKTSNAPLRNSKLKMLLEKQENCFLDVKDSRKRNQVTGSDVLSDNTVSSTSDFKCLTVAPENNDNDGYDDSMNFFTFAESLLKKFLIHNSGGEDEETFHVTAPQHVPLMISKDERLQENGDNCSQTGKDTRKPQQRTVSDNRSNQTACTTTDIESSKMNGALQKESKAGIEPEPTSTAINQKQPENNDHYTNCSKDIYSSCPKELVISNSGGKNVEPLHKKPANVPLILSNLKELIQKREECLTAVKDTGKGKQVIDSDIDSNKTICTTVDIKNSNGAPQKESETGTHLNPTCMAINQKQLDSNDHYTSCPKGLNSSGNFHQKGSGMTDSVGNNEETLDETPSSFVPLMISKHKGLQEKQVNCSQFGKDTRKCNQMIVCTMKDMKSSSIKGALQKETKPSIILEPASMVINQKESDNNDHTTSCSNDLNSFGSPCPKELPMKDSVGVNSKTQLVTPSYAHLMISKHNGQQKNGENCLQTEKDTRKPKEMTDSDEHSNKPGCTLTDIKSSNLIGVIQRESKSGIDVEPTFRGIKQKQLDDNDQNTYCSKGLYSSCSPHVKELDMEKYSETPLLTPSHVPLMISKQKGLQKTGDNFLQVEKYTGKPKHVTVSDNPSNKSVHMPMDHKSSNMTGVLPKETIPSFHLESTFRAMNQKQPDNNDYSTSCSKHLNSSGNPHLKELTMSNAVQKNAESLLLTPSYFPLMISKYKGLQEKRENCLQLGKDSIKCKELTVSDIHKCTMTDIKSSKMTGPLQRESKPGTDAEPTSRGIKQKQPNNNDHDTNCSKGLYSSYNPHVKEWDMGKNSETPLMTPSLVPLLISKHKGPQKTEESCLQVGKHTGKPKQVIVSDNHSNKTVCMSMATKSSNMSEVPQKESKPGIHLELISRGIKRQHPDNNDHYNKKARQEMGKPEQMLIKENGNKTSGIIVSNERLPGENKGPNPLPGFSKIHQFVPYCTSSNQNPPAPQHSAASFRPPMSQHFDQKFSTSTSYHSVINPNQRASHHPIIRQNQCAPYDPFIKQNQYASYRPGQNCNPSSSYNQPTASGQRFAKPFPGPIPGVHSSIKEGLTTPSVFHPHHKELEVSLPIPPDQREEKETMKRKAQMERENACKYTSKGKIQFFVQREKDHAISRAYGYPPYLLKVTKSYLESD